MSYLLLYPPGLPPTPENLMVRLRYLVTKNLFGLTLYEFSSLFFHRHLTVVDQKNRFVVNYKANCFSS